jgi:hypothetical protein
MRGALIGLAFLLQSLLTGAAHAASIQFSVDVDLICNGTGCFPGSVFEPLDGPFEDAGSFTLDESLLGPQQTLIRFNQVENFSLAFPVEDFSYDTASLIDGICFEPSCGLLFTGSHFDGFLGEYLIADATLGSAVRFFEGGINLEFIVPSGTPIGCMSVRCINATDGIAFGDTRITAATPTPEPASWMLLLGGGALVGWRTRKRADEIRR